MAFSISVPSFVFQYCRRRIIQSENEIKKQERETRTHYEDEWGTCTSSMSPLNASEELLVPPTMKELAALGVVKATPDAPFTGFCVGCSQVRA